jgi:hypothetical protein
MWKSRQRVVYPFLIALYPVVSLYAQNVGEARVSELAGPVALVLAGSAAVWVGLRLALKDAARAGLVTVLAVATFDTVSFVPEFADACYVSLTCLWVMDIDAHVWTPLAYGTELALAAALGYAAVARLKDPGAWTARLNTFSVILIALPLAAAARGLAREPAPPTNRPVAWATAPRSNHRPDIYYIVLDGYARTDVMKELFGFDNEPFLKGLERRGFYVARRSTANYAQTPLSLASSLNGTYINEHLHPSAHDKTQLRAWIGDGAVVRTLRGLGYRFVTFATGFDETEHPQADAYLSPHPYLTDFQRLLLVRTPLASLQPDPSLRDPYAMSRERTLYLFDHLPEVARRPGPTFTFAHVVSPHPPFVFGEDGADVSPRRRSYFLNDGDVYRRHYGGADAYVRGYRDQAAFLTRQVERMIDRIIAGSPEPPVIILQSDHGSGLHLDTQSVERTDLHERMSILNAYLLPGLGGEALYDSISPVNSFRVVLNAYFGTGLDLLPDRSYFSTWPQPYRFVDVTDRVRPTPETDRRHADAPGDSPSPTPEGCRPVARDESPADVSGGPQKPEPVPARGPGAGDAPQLP